MLGKTRAKPVRKISINRKIGLREKAKVPLHISLPGFSVSMPMQRRINPNIRIDPSKKRGDQSLTRALCPNLQRLRYAQEIFISRLDSIMHFYAVFPAQAMDL